MLPMNTFKSPSSPYHHNSHAMSPDSYAMTSPNRIQFNSTTSPSSSLTTATPQYLPGFLMGGTVGGGGGTDHRSPPSVQRDPTSLVSPLRGASQPYSGGITQQSPSIKTDIKMPHNQSRTSSPPIQSLWSTMPSCGRSTQQHSSTPTTVGTNNNNASDSFLSPLPPPVGSSGQRSTASSSIRRGRPLVQQQSPYFAFSSPTSQQQQQIGAAMTSSEELLIDSLVAVKPDPSNPDSVDESWVTVFGFPSSRAAFILNQFSQFGNVEKHVLTNDGNWMHIKYQNKLQARCALNKNGRIFGDNVMVGVAPCMDPLTNDGNWMHIKYQNKLQARCALNKNGRIFGDNVMVGVAPCMDPSVQSRFTGPTTTTSREASLVNSTHNSSNVGNTSRSLVLNHSLANASIQSPRRLQQHRQSVIGRGTGAAALSQSMVAGQSSGSRRPSALGRHSSMRSLVGNNRNAQFSRAESIRRSRESGILSKALEYMFGWS